MPSLQDIYKEFRLSPLDLHGVNSVNVMDIPQQEDGYNTLGFVLRSDPTNINLNRDFMNRQAMRETIAHEAEHSRSLNTGKRKPSPYLDTMEYPLGLLWKLRDMPGGETIDKQPSAEEILAFIRGKEAIGNKIDYTGLLDSSKRWVDANIFAGMPRFLEPTDVDKEFYNKPKREPSLLDLFRRKMRAFTSGR